MFRELLERKEAFLVYKNTIFLIIAQFAFCKGVSRERRRPEIRLCPQATHEFGHFLLHDKSGQEIMFSITKHNITIFTLSPAKPVISVYPFFQRIKIWMIYFLCAIPHHTDAVSCTCSACLLLAKRKSSCKTSSLLVKEPLDIAATHYLSFILHFTQRLFCYTQDLMVYEGTCDQPMTRDQAILAPSIF